VGIVCLRIRGWLGITNTEGVTLVVDNRFLRVD
jgi:hypothetical protein